MLSIADIIDKLVIENIKIFNLREKLHECETTDEEYVETDKAMNIINENRSIIMQALNDKIDGVFSKKIKNRVLRDVKTYHKPD